MRGGGALSSLRFTGTARRNAASSDDQTALQLSFQAATLCTDKVEAEFAQLLSHYARTCGGSNWLLARAALGGLQHLAQRHVSHHALAVLQEAVRGVDDAELCRAYGSLAAPVLLAGQSTPLLELLRSPTHCSLKAAVELACRRDAPSTVAQNVVATLLDLLHSAEGGIRGASQETVATYLAQVAVARHDEKLFSCVHQSLFFPSSMLSLFLFVQRTLCARCCPTIARSSTHKQCASCWICSRRICRPTAPTGWCC